MQSWFHDIADHAESVIGSGEEISLGLAAEITGFARISSGRVRQSGSIEQRHLFIALRKDGREVCSGLMLSGSLEADREQLRATISNLSEMVSQLPRDPHLPRLPEAIRDEHRGDGQIPDPEQVIASLAGEAADLETCGLAITGTIYRAAASSTGLRRWYEAPRTVIDGSMHLRGGGATKWAWAGENWDPISANRRRQQAHSMAEILALPVETPPVGKYRAWLEPAAVEDLFGPVLWSGAFSARAVKTGTSPMASLYDQTQLDPRVVIRDNPGAIGAPAFNASGHTIPAPVELVTSGAGRGQLTSPRTAMEFGLEHNGASSAEMPSCLEMGPGTLDPETSHEQVGDGLWLSHVHYTNLAAREGARITGVTRWMALRIKDGRPVAPIGTVRIDDSLIRMLGEGLVDLGSTTEVLPDLSTYRQRSPSGSKLPGILVDDLRVVG